MFLQEQIEEMEKFDDAGDVAWVNNVSVTC
jgi:hypothetical protein